MPALQMLSLSRPSSKYLALIEVKPIYDKVDICENICNLFFDPLTIQLASDRF